MTSDEPGATVFDRLFVEVRNTSGTLLATLATFSNVDEVPTTGAYTFRGNYDVSSFRGQTVRIQFPRHDGHLAQHRLPRGRRLAAVDRFARTAGSRTLPAVRLSRHFSGADPAGR